MDDKKNNVLRFGISEKLETNEDFEPIVVNEEECEFDRDNPSKDVVQDYEFIRRKIRKVISISEAILDRSLTDMAINPGPRIIEANSTIIKSMVDCSAQLLQLHEKRKKINLIEEPINDIVDEEEQNKPKPLKAKVNDIIETFQNEEEDIE